jgi:hypothetical protein
MKVRHIFCFILFFVFITGSLLAQPGDPAGDPDVPITGIEILLGMGAALGVKRILGLNRKSKNQ